MVPQGNNVTGQTNTTRRGSKSKNISKVSKACFQKTQSPATTIFLSAPKFLCDTTVHFSKLFNEDLTVHVSSFSETLELMAVSLSAKIHIKSQLKELSDNEHEMLIVLKAGFYDWNSLLQFNVHQTKKGSNKSWTYLDVYITYWQADLYSEPFLGNLLYYLVRASWKLRINISWHAY